MGWRYVNFRAGFELKKRVGILKRKFPINPVQKQVISLEEWKKLKVKYFFSSREFVKVEKRPNKELKEEFEKFLNGEVLYFNATYHKIGKDYNWLTNPSNGYQHDITKHWLEIPDLSTEAGDIKYIWEKSRFSFLYTLMRYDFHFEEDHAKIVFEEIESWIDSNPINQGPNWICSQEISLRTMNWLFALNFYKNSKELTEERFQKIIHVIYWQLKHVYANINFSRIAVRNNHAITEVLMLYIGGMLFPFFPEAKVWKTKGKKWFEEEIDYQIYEDGTFLQFSHNYHRVVIQLLTLGFNLAELNNESFSSKTYDRARKSLNYLYQCCNESDGHLPNYGPNDGALFFNLNDENYRDYRPQLNALAYFFNRKYCFEDARLQEDGQWYSSNIATTSQQEPITLSYEKISTFDVGGYYLIRDDKSFAFIKCGAYKNRPTHADNLHFDLWYKGVNVLRDAGSYRYNTDKSLISYFKGTKAHNTVVLGEETQMKQGPRFIWFNWSQSIYVLLKETIESIVFEGKIKAFGHLDPNITHERKVTKSKYKNEWIILDFVEHTTDLPLKQYWNISKEFETNFDIEAVNEQGDSIPKTYNKAWYSSFYGVKEESKAIVFESYGKYIKTIIKEK